jgi:hypothetical protein
MIVQIKRCIHRTRVARNSESTIGLLDLSATLADQRLTLLYPVRKRRRAAGRLASSGLELAAHLVFSIFNTGFLSFDPRKLTAERHLTDLERRGRGEQTKLPHHSNVVPIRKVLSDLAIEHPIHVDVLNLKGAPGRLHTDEHSAIDRKA